MDNIEIIRCFIEKVWNGRQLDLLDQIMDPDYQVHYTPVEHGIAGYRKIWHETIAAAPDVQFTMEDLMTADDKVILRYHVTGFAGPTTEPVAGIAIYRIADGKMAECWAPLIAAAADPPS